MDVNLNYLKTFALLSELLNFSKTAQVLRIAQPAVSRQIRELERQLSVSLFVRDNRRVELTPAGRQLQQGIRPLIKTFQNCLMEVRNQQNLVQGDLRIACPRELGELVIAPIISKFIQNHPGVRLEARFGSTIGIDKQILEGDLHLGISLERNLNANIRSYRLLQQKIFMLTNLKSATTNLKYRNLRYVAYQGHDRILEKFAKVQLRGFSLSQLNVHLYMNSHGALVDFLKLHPNYFAVLPYYSHPIKTAVDNRTLKTVGNLAIDSDIFLEMANLDYVPNIQKTFIAFLKSEVQQNYGSVITGTD